MQYICLFQCSDISFGPSKTIIFTIQSYRLSENIFIVYYINIHQPITDLILVLMQRTTIFSPDTKAFFPLSVVSLSWNRALIKREYLIIIFLISHLNHML